MWVFNDMLIDVMQISSTLIVTDGESVDYNLLRCYYNHHACMAALPTTVIFPTLLITVLEPPSRKNVKIH